MEKKKVSVGSRWTRDDAPEELDEGIKGEALWKENSLWTISAFVIAGTDG